MSDTDTNTDTDTNGRVTDHTFPPPPPPPPPPPRWVTTLPGDCGDRHVSVQAVLKHFRYGHLKEPWRSVSRRFADLAVSMADDAPECLELTVCLRKLLEAKDAGVRAFVEA